MPLRVGSINNTLFYTADFLYEDLNTPSRGRCIMEFKYDIIPVSFDRGIIRCEPYRSKGLLGLCILKIN